MFAGFREVIFELVDDAGEVVVHRRGFYMGTHEHDEKAQCVRGGIYWEIMDFAEGEVRVESRGISGTSRSVDGEAEGNGALM
jgi:hypothetical protein